MSLHVQFVCTHSHVIIPTEFSSHKARNCGSVIKVLSATLKTKVIYVILIILHRARENLSQITSNFQNFPSVLALPIVFVLSYAHSGRPFSLLHHAYLHHPPIHAHMICSHAFLPSQFPFLYPSCCAQKFLVGHGDLHNSHIAPFNMGVDHLVKISLLPHHLLGA
jgi:hypothetical protein